MKVLFVFLLASALLLTSCNATQIATDTSNALSAILSIAAAETPQIPTQDQQIYSGFVALGQSLNAQLNTCIQTVGKKAVKLLSCFNTFATGLNTPAEMTQLRLLSPKTQNRVQLYLTAAIVAINVALKFYSGPPATPATVAMTQPSEQDLRELALAANLDTRLLNYGY